MNTQELEQFKRQLCSLRIELQRLEQAAKKTATPEEQDHTGMGRLSLMATMLAQQRAQEGSVRRQRLLQKIEGALRRIDSGEYGTCFMCETDIDIRILSEDPTSTRCMNCAEE